MPSYRENARQTTGFSGGTATFSLGENWGSPRDDSGVGSLRILAGVAMLASALCGMRPAALSAAEVGGPEGQEEAEPGSRAGQNVFAPPDRTTFRLLGKAEQLMEQGRYAEAVRCLGAIFESPQDYFFWPEGGDPRPRSLKAEAQRLLGRMSRSGRELYELQYGARARQMLTAAAAAGDAAALAEVSRRFFHTEAGYEATMLLGLHHLDHGRPLAGALALERLREASPSAGRFEPALSVATATCWIRAGMAERASDVLSVLREHHPGASVEIGGEEVRLFGEDFDAAERLAELLGPQVTSDADRTDQWGLFRGDAARNASTRSDGPLLSMRWRVPISDHPGVEALIEGACQADREWERPALPVLHPLVVDDMVLMRTARGLVAMDFATGKRVWESPVDDPFDTLMSLASELASHRTAQLEYALRLRVWADATYGTMSSDGESVFAIEDLGLELSPMRFHAAFVRGRAPGDPAGPKPSNRLAAYDVRTGKLKWHVGGSAEEFGLAQAGTFFLGPPLPLMARLYVLAEIMGEIRLVVLDGKTGELIWFQQLAGADQPLPGDALRRMAGISPSYADGILVCPTANRSIVAVDVATRSLLWGYTYSATDPRDRQRAMFWPQAILDPDPAERWIDSSVILAEGRALVTPVDSSDVHCLNLIDGTLLWREPRQDDLYLACVHDGKAILVGRQQVRAVDVHRTMEARPLETYSSAGHRGENDSQHAKQPARAWGGRGVRFPSGSSPSGMGFLSGSHYYVPLTSAAVMAVDLDAGRSARVFGSRQDDVPGNMICYRGRIVSQGATGLDVFPQLEALRREVDERLAVDREDADALALRGEVLWNEGSLDEAIGCLRRSLELKPAVGTRKLLRDALLEGLRVQFATQRDDSDEIRRLLDGPEQEATYLRLMATGLEEAGELRSAWEHYLRLIALDRGHRGMEPVEKSHSVRRDRWIQVRLAKLREGATAEIRAEIDQEAETRWKAAVGEGSAEAVELFLDYFGALPIGEGARRRLARRLEESGRMLSAELLLRRLERSEDPEVRGAAVAELAGMLHGSQRWQDADVCCARLEGEFADVVCVDGKTGREVAEALSAKEPPGKRVPPVSSWPVGKVEVNISQPSQQSASAYRDVALPFEGGRGPFFSGTSIELRERPQPPRLVASDGLGNAKWQLPLAELLREGYFPFEYGLMRVGVCEHLLFLTSGQRILAIDTLGDAETRSPRLLWSLDLDEPFAEGAGRWRLQLRTANWGRVAPRFHPGSEVYEVTGEPRVLSEQVLCFKRLGNCVGVDPSTGKTLWLRRDVPRESEMFGDHEYVFVVPSGQTTATVLRAADGEVLGQREVPRERQRTLGRLVLVWRAVPDGQVLELVDPWDNRHAWPPRKFASGATLHQVEDEAVAVYEPDGRFVLVDLSDGRTIIEAKLQAQPALPEILVFSSPEQYLVLAYTRSPSPFQTDATYMLDGVASQRIARGLVYAFDREGNKLWPSSVVVSNQWLPLSQPDRLPVLTFACKVQERQVNGRMESKASILCIDKRNGRAICRKEFPGPTNTFHLVGNPEKKTVELHLRQAKITMTFTDRPLGPETDASDAPEADSSEPEEKPTATKAIWKAILRALGEAP